MADKTEKAHGLNYADGMLTVNGVEKVLEVSAKEASFKLASNTLVVHGTGLNVVKLDREQGVVKLETQSISSMVYRPNGVNLKGLFR